MSLSKAQELRRDRARLIEEARQLLTAAGDGPLAAETEEKFDRIMADAERMEQEIRAIESAEDRRLRLEEEERKLRESQGVKTAAASADPAEAAEVRQERQRTAFRNWLRWGPEGLSVEERQTLRQSFQALSPELRALAAGTGSEGGFTVPEGFYAQLVEAQKQFGAMRQVATIITTATGNPLPIPTENDTTNTGALVGENQEHSAADPAFGQVVLNGYMYSSKIVKVSRQLLQDSAFDIDSYLARKLGIRIGRITNQHFTTGDGSSKPYGVVTQSAAGKTGASGQTTTVTYVDLVDLEHSVDIAYRANARWMAHDSTIKALKKLVDDQSRPLWVPGVAVREPDTILGYPWVVNNDMPVMAASAKSILFGDFSTYFIRDVTGTVLLRLVERYAEFGQVGFLALERHDGALVDAGTNPVKHYANAAS